MSKIAKKPVQIKAGVTVTYENGVVKVVGGKGEQSFQIPQGIKITIEGENIVIAQENKSDESKKALSGLTRSLINNMVKGVDSGFEKVNGRLDM